MVIDKTIIHTAKLFYVLSDSNWRNMTDKSKLSPCWRKCWPRREISPFVYRLASWKTLKRHYGIVVTVNTVQSSDLLKWNSGTLKQHATNDQNWESFHCQS